MKRGAVIGLLLGSAAVVCDAKPPRLAVVIAIDQCHADYLERFGRGLSPAGSTGCWRAGRFSPDAQWEKIRVSYSKPRISGFLKRTLKRKTFFSSE